MDETAALNEEAARWYARRRSGVALSEAEEARFRAWCASRPENQRAYDELDALWIDLGALEDSPEVREFRSQSQAEPGATLSAAAVREMPAQGAGPRAERTSQAARAAWVDEQRSRMPLPVDGETAGDRRSEGRSVLPWALAATVLLAVGVGAAFVFRPQAVAPAAVAYATTVGEQRRISLEDGSAVVLNTSSEISVKYTGDLRSLTLVSGQATFEVAKDVKRPFVVSVGQGTVTALGTVFDVYRRDDRVTVTLVEGRVAVIPKVDVADAGGAAADLSREPASAESGDDDGSMRTIVLTAGQQVSYAEANPLPTRTEADLRRALAWREKKMDFQDTLLPEAIAEANRYSRVKIELQAPELENARMSGVFETDGRGFVEGVQAYFGLQAVPVGEDRIVLRK